jgi:2,4-dienoyl-CoA reductase (NADPH2)
MWPFKLDNLDDLIRMREELKVPLEVSEDVGCLRQAVSIGPLSAPNSLAVQPMEGCDGDAAGRPRPLTARRYERFAGGGAGLLWFEAIAVAGEGRANPRQLWLNGETAGDFEKLVRQTRETARQRCGADHRPVLIAQLTHSGRYSKPDGTAKPVISCHDPYRDAMAPQIRPDKNFPMKLPPEYPVLTDDELDRLQASYVKAARLAFEAGFDGVDIKACHGYLISELLAGHTRQGRYGGAFENRTRFLLDVVERVREAAGSGKIITTRLGMYDALPLPYGWGVDREDYARADLAEPMKLIGLLEERGVAMVNVTLANPYYNPHCNRPFNQPVKGGYESPEHPLTGVSRAIELAGQVQRAFPKMAIVGSGYSWLQMMMPFVGAGVKRAGKAALIGAGRMAFAYPDFAHDILEKGQLDPDRVCISCSACSQIMRDGGITGCPVRDREVYGPIYRKILESLKTSNPREKKS